MGLLAQSVQTIGQAAGQMSAANRGYVAQNFTPGAPSTPGTSPVYVNPATGAQWTSPNLAYIASLVPGGVQTPPNAGEDDTEAPNRAPSALANTAGSSGRPLNPLRLVDDRREGYSR